MTEVTAETAVEAVMAAGNDVDLTLITILIIIMFVKHDKEDLSIESNRFP